MAETGSVDARQPLFETESQAIANVFHFNGMKRQGMRGWVGPSRGKGAIATCDPIRLFSASMKAPLSTPRRVYKEFTSAGLCRGGFTRSYKALCKKGLRDFLSDPPINCPPVAMLQVSIPASKCMVN